MLNMHSKLLLIALLEGAVVMVIQLLTGQILAPFFGTGLHTWASVIGTTLSCLALGYFLGGKWSKKNDTHLLIYWLLWAAAIWILILPGIGKMAIYTLSKASHITGLLITCALTLSPVLVLMGSIPILIVNTLSRSTHQAGFQTGKVYTFSTIGGILGLLVTGFYALPNHGITLSVLTTGIILGAAAITGLISNKKPLSLAIVLIVPLAWTQLPGNIKGGNIQTLHYSEGLHGQVMVADISSGEEVTRGLFVNRIAQTYVDPTNMQPKPSYIKGIANLALTKVKNPKSLVIGLAGGTLSNQLLAMGHQVTAVELDARLPQLAKTHFGISEQVNIAIDDGRHFIEATQQRFHLIIVDAFRGEAIPGHLLTIEAFQQMKLLLFPGGKVLVNFNGFLEGARGKGGRAVLKTMNASELHTTVFTTREDPLHRNSLYLELWNPNRQTIIRGARKIHF